MNLNTTLILIVLHLLYSQISLALPNNVKVELKVKRASIEEQEKLKHLLQSFQHFSSDTELEEEAKLILERLGGLQSVVCQKLVFKIRCEGEKKRTIRKVIIQNLPLAILEQQFRQHVFIHAGDSLEDEEAQTRTKIQKQRKILEDELERQGYLGAKVLVKTPRVPKTYDVDLLISIEGGAFTQVRNVYVQMPQDMPLQIVQGQPDFKKDIVNALKSLCLKPERFLDAVFRNVGTQCFHPQYLQETIQDLELRYRQQGYSFIRLPAEIKNIQLTKNHHCREAQRISIEKTPPKSTGYLACVDIFVTVQEPIYRSMTFVHDGGKQRLTKSSGFLGWFLKPLTRSIGLLTGIPPTQTEDFSVASQDILQEGNNRAMIPFLTRALEQQREQLTEYIKINGYPFVELESASQKVHPYFYKMGHAITWGIPAWIRHIEIQGNQFFKEQEIFDAMKFIRVRGTWSSGYYDEKLLKLEEESLLLFYREQGFPNAQVSIQSSMEPTGAIDFKVRLREGYRENVAQLRINNGISKIDRDLIPRLLLCASDRHARKNTENRNYELPQGILCSGSPYKESYIEYDRNTIEKKYRAQGYLNSRIVVEKKITHTGYYIIFNVEDELILKKFSLGAVVIRGLYTTRHDVVLRELTLKPYSGQEFIPEHFEESIQRLRSTGLFSRVEYEIVMPTEKDSRVHLILQLEEAARTTGDVSLAFATQSLFALKTEWRDQNFFGTMLHVNAMLQWGIWIGRESKATTMLRWPHIGGSDLSLQVIPFDALYRDEPAQIRLTTPSVTGAQQVNTVWGKPDLRRRITQLSSSLNMDWKIRKLHPWFDHKTALGVGLEVRADWNTPAGSPVRPLSVEAFATMDGLLWAFQELPSTQNLITPRLSYINIDNPFDPHQGLSIEINAKIGVPPLNRYLFTVVQPQIKGYLPIDNRTTLGLAARARMGFTADIPQCTGDCRWALMQNDLWMLGGDRTVRGYAANQISSTGTLYRSNLEPVLFKGESVVGPHPSLFAGVLNIELRQQWGDKLGIGVLKPALFFDVGFASSDGMLIASSNQTQQNSSTTVVEEIRNVGYSVGAGIRYVTPVGPLSVDFAYAPLIENYAVHVLFGYVF